MRVQNIIFKNFGLRMVALVLAFFVWAMIAGKERSYSEKNIEVAVEYYGVANNIDVRSVVPDSVRLKIRGTTRDLNNIIDDDFRIRIDLKRITEGTRINFLTEDVLEHPENIRIMNIHPKMIAITAAELLTREVPVRVRYKGNMQRGIKLVSRKVVPEKVRIFGYKAQIGLLQNVEATEWIILDNLEESQVIKLRLRKDREILRFEDTDTVEVHIVVEDLRKEQEEHEKKETTGNAKGEKNSNQNDKGVTKTSINKSADSKPVKERIYNSEGNGNSNWN
jgi:YbbR domain-containing protein